MKYIFAILAPLLVLLPSFVTAHEFWLSPKSYQVDAGDTISADIRVGQGFKGSAYAYIPNSVTRFDIVGPDGTAPVDGRMGDRPAVAFTGDADGLYVLVHETSDSRLTYSEWEKFVSFVEHKDAVWTVARHLERGLPQTKFIETYRRYAKALVGVGSAAGQDAQTGLAFELVALANPYTDDLSDGMLVQLFRDGVAVPDAQVEVFAKPVEGEVTTTTYRTDGDGIARLPVQAGVEYLVDSVQLLERPGDAEPERLPTWHSDWAALTFRVPAE